MSSALDRRLSRRRFLGATAAGGAALLMGGGASSALAYDPPTDAGIRRARRRDEDEDWFEASFRDLQRLMRRGEISSVGLTKAYLRRIRDLNPVLGAVIETNPQALAIAARRDKERRRGTRPRPAPRHPDPAQGQHRHRRPHGDDGRLAGARRAAGCRRDAAIVARLRRAGAVILGKANLSEWANFRGFGPPGFLNGWSARGGFTRNPYVLDCDPCGSCSGSAVAPAANLCAARGRHRDRRLDRVPGRQQRRGRAQAHARAGVAAGDHPDRPQPGHGRPDGPHRDRRGDPAQRHGDAVRRRSQGRPAAARTTRSSSSAARCRAPASASTGCSSTEDYFAEPELNAVVEDGARRHGRARRHDRRRSTPATPIRTGSTPSSRSCCTSSRLDIAAYLRPLRHTTMRTLADLIAFNLAHCARGDDVLRPGDLRHGRGDQRRPDRPGLPGGTSALRRAGRAAGDRRACSTRRPRRVVSPAYSLRVLGGGRRRLPEHLGAGRASRRTGGPGCVWMYGRFLDEPRLLALAYDLEQRTREARHPEVPRRGAGAVPRCRAVRGADIGAVVAGGGRAPDAGTSGSHAVLMMAAASGRRPHTSCSPTCTGWVRQRRPTPAHAPDECGTTSFGMPTPAAATSPAAGPRGPRPTPPDRRSTARCGPASSVDGSARHASIVSASHASISLNAVQRWNGQPASRQIRSSDRFANTMSA